MTIDLSTARAGCEVQFRCGGVARIHSVPISGSSVRLSFGGGGSELWWNSNGHFTGQDHPLDIISITDPPLTEAERLAEIARLMNAWCSKTAAGRSEGVAIPPERWIEILALAEGRAP